MTPGAQFLNTPGGSAYPSARSTPVQSARGGPGGIPVPPKFESPSRADLRAKMTQAEARAEATERALASERAELEKVRKEISIMRVEQGAWEKAASPVASPAKPTAAERERRVKEATQEALRESVRVALASGVNEAELRDAMAQRGVDVGAILAEQIPPAPTPEIAPAGEEDKSGESKWLKVGEEDKEPEIAPAGEDKPGGSKWLKVGDDKETPEQTTTQKADIPAAGGSGKKGKKGKKGKGKK